MLLLPQLTGKPSEQGTFARAGCRGGLLSRPTRPPAATRPTPAGVLDPLATSYTPSLLLGWVGPLSGLLWGLEASLGVAELAAAWGTGLRAKGVRCCCPRPRHWAQAALRNRITVTSGKACPAPGLGHKGRVPSLKEGSLSPCRPAGSSSHALGGKATSHRLQLVPEA